jgi:hypothetical protein
MLDFDRSKEKERRDKNKFGRAISLIKNIYIYIFFFFIHTEVYSVDKRKATFKLILKCGRRGKRKTKYTKKEIPSPS